MISGETAIARKLLETGNVEVNAEDLHGWPPLHHAALLSNACMINLLQKYGAKDCCKNDRDGSPVDFFEMLHADTKKIESPILEMKENGELVEMSPEEFQLFANAVYIERMMLAPETLIHDWGKVDHRHLNFDASYKTERKMQYLEHFKSPSKMALQRTTRDETGKPLPIGACAVAAADIMPGEMVGEYLGEYYESAHVEHGQEGYLLENIDGARFRNLTSFIQDGFPNVYGYTLENVNGLVTRSVFIASEPIKKGSPIVMDYATHPVKYSGTEGALGREVLNFRYFEMRPLALTNFLQNTDIEAILKAFTVYNKSNKGEIGGFEDYPKLEQILYLMNTPLAYLKHSLQGNICLKQLRLVARLPFTNFSTTPYAFQAFAIDSIMEQRENYQILREYLLKLLDYGNTLVPQQILSMVEENFEAFKDPAGSTDRDYSFLHELAIEFLESGKEVLAIELINVYLKKYDMIGSVSKERLKSLMLEGESIIRSKYVIETEVSNIRSPHF